MAYNDESVRQVKSELTKNTYNSSCLVSYLGPLLLTWFNFNPSMDK